MLDINSDHKDNTYFFKGKKYTTDDFIANAEACIFPTQLFFNKLGEKIHTLIGYRAEKEFKDILSYIYTKAYKTTNIDSYLSDLAFERE